MKPVIAMPITGTDLFRRYMTGKYVNALKKAGADIRWISLADPAQAAEEVVLCDGLLLPGGGDIDPMLYGQEPIPACGKPDNQRDVGEMVLLEAFFPTNKPIFGICRGVQVMNVFFGGTLHQDIKPTQKCRHSDFHRRAFHSHGIEVVPGTRLHGILGAEQVKVNSMHHQAAERPAHDLLVSALSEDGFIEALEHKHHPFCLGVQWHPEHMAPLNAQQRKFFTAFVDACR